VAILILRPKAAINQAVAVDPILAPKINPIPPDKLIKPALINEIVITETNELEFKIAVIIAPTVILLYNLLVTFFKIFLKNPFVKTLNPFSNIIIPKSKIATPAAIVLKFGLKNNTTPSMTKRTKKDTFLNIN